MSIFSRAIISAPLFVTCAVIGCSGHADMDVKPSLAELFSSASDFDLCNGVFLKIGDQYGHVIAADEYSDEERVVMLVWHAKGIIDNGGFEYLFSGDFPGDPGYRLTAKVFESLESARAVTAFRKALAIFPSSELPADIDSRMEIYLRVSESKREAINKTFWSAGWDGEIKQKLAQYIRDHRSAFTNLE